MAEKYGTIPPRFTKAWWDYFWMYYKGYVIAIVLVIILSAVTVYQILTRPSYDTTMMYVGSYAFSDEAIDDISKAISPLCEDVDGNGEKALNFTELCLSSDDIEYNTAMNQKLYLTLAADEVYLYLLESEVALAYIEDNPEESAFIALSEWSDKDFSEDAVLSHNGTAYGVRIDEIEVFRQILQKYKLDLSDTYLFVRYPPRDDQKEQVPGYEAALKTTKRLFTN